MTSESLTTEITSNVIADNLKGAREILERRQILRCKQTEALIDLAVELFQQAKESADAGALDCGTGSDVSYACAQIYRDIAEKIERIAFIP